MWKHQKTFDVHLLPVLTVRDLKVHVHSEDKHVTLHAHFIQGGGWQRVSQCNQAHRTADRVRGARDKSRAAADSPRHVDHLTKTKPVVEWDEIRKLLILTELKG